MKNNILIGLIIVGSIILYDLYFNKIREGLKKVEDACVAKKPDLCVKILDNKEKIKQLNKKTSIVKKAYDEMFKIVQENITLSTNNKKANDGLDEQFS
ncbi:MAG: hypothetical protein CML42_09620 [Rhodobacteraceae bacterium]|nr:hypothetical protein [Paracoccaceae bacterium]|tara:strand:+ start:31665 stop:31958 length:294 start_codon:yes stop_codon:yes gene_type:complete